MLCTRIRSCYTSHRLARCFSTEKKISEVKTDGEVEYYKPSYATKVVYDQKKTDQRFSKYDSDSGQKPTKMQRRFLVITQLYKNQAEIPEYVANGTMNRMHDRMRAVYIITATTIFFTIFLIMESWNAQRIIRDKERGKIVTRME